LKREFVASQPKGLSGYAFTHTFHFIQDSPRLDDRYPAFGSSLSFAHTRFRGFFSKWLVRENANPNFPSPFHMSGDSHTSRFNLLGRHKTAFQGLKPKVTKF
jgi:hypothetical protein